MGGGPAHRLGQTSMDNNVPYHIPVLVDEVVTFLSPQPDKVYLDVTFGGGGHTRAILEAEPECSVIAMDWDRHALDLNGPILKQQYGGRVHVLWGNFGQLGMVLKKEGIDKVDGILADIGTSHYQLAQQPGFSFLRDSPLDMRMSPAHQKVSAAEIINKASEEKLKDIFWKYGEERFTKSIVAAIIKERKRAPIVRTLQLADIVERVVPAHRRRIHPATKIFQALRIFINHELDNLQSFIPAALRVINPGGRLVIISFHSLEDRIVKHSFNAVQAAGSGHVLTPSAITARAQEQALNPASRSAKLRAIEVLAL